MIFCTLLLTDSIPLFRSPSKTMADWAAIMNASAAAFAGTRPVQPAAFSASSSVVSGPVRAEVQSGPISSGSAQTAYGPFSITPAFPASSPAPAAAVTSAPIVISNSSYEVGPRPTRVVFGEDGSSTSAVSTGALKRPPPFIPAPDLPEHLVSRLPADGSTEALAEWMAERKRRFPRRARPAATTTPSAATTSPAAASSIDAVKAGAAPTSTLFGLSAYGDSSDDDDGDAPPVSLPLRGPQPPPLIKPCLPSAAPTAAADPLSAASTAGTAGAGGPAVGRDDGANEPNRAIGASEAPDGASDEAAASNESAVSRDTAACDEAVANGALSVPSISSSSSSTSASAPAPAAAAAATAAASTAAPFSAPKPPRPALVSSASLNPWARASASGAAERLLLSTGGLDLHGGPRALTAEALADGQRQHAALTAALRGAGAGRGGRGGGSRGARGGGRGERGGTRGGAGVDVPPPSVSLMRKLFAEEVQREHSRVLQCIHYIVENGFFLNDPLPLGGAGST